MLGPGAKKKYHCSSHVLLKTKKLRDEGRDAGRMVSCWILETFFKGSLGYNTVTLMVVILA